jgi:NAD(P)-dependent dehydrogenase (short-subunit alcohol dehydrogenase family)
MNEAEPAAPGAGTGDRWRLDGRVGLVTGASAGLGARFARVLHTGGAHVIATARRADRLEDLAQHCGSRIQAVTGDIADSHHRQAVIEMLRPHGRLQRHQSRPDQPHRHLAAVWGQDGVRVNALAPGYFPTELTGFLSDPAFAQSIRDRTLLGRIPEPGELDGPLLFLATDASSYMTGQALVIDGGWTAV